MAAMKITLLAVAAISAVLLGTASAATYGVGEPGGSWTLNTDYSNWVSNKKFHPGDEIVFKYSTPAHNVVEVSKAGYDSCSTDSAINTLTSGNDVVAINATGTRYFICGIPGHCSPTPPASMKRQLTPRNGRPFPHGGCPSVTHASHMAAALQKRAPPPPACRLRCSTLSALSSTHITTPPQPG
uniref:Blue copper protein n=1 Tax=Aegilops tauschii TaxID=37682 RepID=N1QW23_AEGTA